MRVQQDDPTANWTMPGAYQVDTGLYRIPLPLPHSTPSTGFEQDCAEHLDVLAVAGRLRRSDTDGISYYAKD